jgi:hypothetical protein
MGSLDPINNILKSLQSQFAAVGRARRAAIFKPTDAEIGGNVASKCRAARARF